MYRFDGHTWVFELDSAQVTYVRPEGGVPLDAGRLAITATEPPSDVSRAIQTHMPVNITKGKYVLSALMRHP